MNTSTIQIEIQVDGKGGIKVLKQIGAESEKTGKKGQKGFRTMARSAKNLNREINLTRGLATKLGTAFGLWKLWQVSQGFHEVAVEAERTQAMLEGLYGSAEKGRAAFGWIMGLDVPFGLGAIQDSFVKFRSVGIDPTTGSLEALLAGVAAFGGSDEVLKRASIAIQQMAGKGVISMEELRQQLGEAIPTAIPIMAEQLGMTVRKMVDIISKGQLDASTGIDAFFTGMAAKYGSAIARMMGTWGGMTRKMAKEWTAFRIQVMGSGPFQVMKERLGDLLTEIDRLKKNGQLDLWAADMADGVLASIDLMMAGFQALSKVVLGFRGFFGILTEKFYGARLKSINEAIKDTEAQINSTWQKILVPGANTKEWQDYLRQQLDGLKAQRAEFIQNKQAGQDMAMSNIQKMDQYSQKIQKARDKLAQLRADMEARRGERPGADTDLSIDKKKTVPGPDPQALKDYKALMTEVEKAQKEFRDAMIIPSGTYEIMEQQLRRGIGADITVRDSEKIREAYASMYSDLKFQSDEYYPYQLEQLQRQAEDYEAYTGDAALAHQWLCEQIKELDKERLEAARKSNQYYFEMTERTMDAIEDNFSSFFRDFFRGELDSAEDYFRAFCHSLTDSFSDMMGQMTREFIFGGGSSGSSGIFSSLLSWGAGLFGGGASLDASAGLGADWAGTLWHKGGKVGHDTAPTRTVPSALFTHAPRLHQGLAGDEFPAILQKGETVIPKGQPVQNLTITVPVTIEGQADERLASILSQEIEETAKRVMREEMR